MGKQQRKQATDRKSFLIYKDLDDQIKDLTVTQAGHLFKSIFAYQNNYAYECDDVLANFALKGFVSQFKREKLKYANKVAKCSDAG